MKKRIGVIKMRPLQRMSVGVVAAVLAALVPAVAMGQTAQFVAALSGANEVPPVTTTAVGTFTGALDEAAGTFSWTLEVPEITDATAAHIHSGAAGSNGPIVVNLFAAPGGSPADSVSVAGTAAVADLTGPLAGDFAAFVAALEAGTLYVNVHTTANPGGEIRAQVTAAPGPADTGNAGLSLDRGTDLAGLTLAGLALAVVVVGSRALTSRRPR